MGTRTVDQVARVAQVELAQLGFTKRSGAIFTVDLGDELLGWLGLNSATEHHVVGSVSVHPVVGIRHQAVQRLVAELMEMPFHAYIPPTVSTPMYTLVAKHQYVNWFVDTTSPGMANQVADLVRSVRAHGYPWIKASASLDAICRLLDEQIGLPTTSYHRPVAWLLAGRRDRAQEALADSLRDIGTRADPAALHYRRFADRLNDHLAHVTLQHAD